MIGLDRFLRRRFGTVPQIDLDKQTTRSVVTGQHRFDFATLTQGLKECNVGVHGFTLDVTAKVAAGQVHLVPTGQAFPLEGDPPQGPAGEPQELRFEVQDWESTPKLKVVAPAPKPDAGQ